MEGAVVTASKGVMESVLAKLKDLVWDTGANLIGVSSDIQFLMDELPAMNALLEKLEGKENLDPQVKNWRNQVLEMTYNIEDCIDDFKNNMTSLDAKANLISKVTNFIITLRPRFETAMQIKELRARLQAIGDRRKRYKIDDCTSSATIERLDARLPALYNEATSLVGIDNPKEDLIKWILDGDRSLKVVSIVGTGGLGKTTLANEVHREVGGHFICKAFVSVSSNPDMTRILTSMLSQLKQQDPKIHTACDVPSILDNLIQYVRDKRYLIIIDDLWDVPPWNTIICAFPENNRQSRVIVTTRDMTVARACCSDHEYIHDMQPLSDTNSRALFLKRISISEYDSRFQNSETVLCQILKKCGGLPLAIITIASILACQQFGSSLKQQWEFIQNCLADQSAANPSLQDMVHILDLSYKILPHHLKSCFLYLGKYPEDHIIRRDDLVRQWMAEGFVTSSPGRDVWDIAEGYFYGLVNRSMIQPVCDRFDNTMVYACRVHDMVLELILKRCREYNFITVVRDPQKVAEAQYKVRRLSINMSGAEHATMTIATTSLLSQVRSLSMFGGPDWMPPLLEFRFIRVLFLDFIKLVERIDLTCIIQLSHLRYLKIELSHWSSNIELPSQIQRLQYLETLELPGWLDFCLPSDIVDLPRLSHLIVTRHARLPDGIGKLNLLRTLDGFCLQKSSSENIKALGALTNLVDLTLYHSVQGNSESMLTKTCALSSALEKLSSLKRIYISVEPENTYCPGDGLSSLSPPFRNLESLLIDRVTFCRVPRWIGDLRNLRTLRLGLNEISNSSWEEDVGIIGTLPSLVSLDLQIGGVPTERIVISRTMGFAALKDFSFDCDGMSRLSFEAGAMPNLRMLWLYFDPRGWDKGAPAGLEHLPSLKEIEACKAGPPYWSMPDSDVLIRDVLQEFVGDLPSRPAFTFRENQWRQRPARTHHDAS